MMLEPKDRKVITSYVSVVFALSWALDVIVYFQGGLANPRSFQILVGVQMLIPALVAVAFRSLRREGFRGTGLCLGKKRYYLAAFALMAVFLGLSFGLSALTPWLTLDGKLTKFQELILAITAKSGQAFPMSVGVFAALMAVQMGILGAILGIPAYWGEEYGWRGYLLPKLLGLGKIRAIAVHGVIWGLWHAPVIAMGFNYPGHPVAGIGFMTVFAVLMGAVFAWLYYASGSIFVPALAHGFLNQGAAYGLFFVAGHHSLLGGPTGLIGLLVLAALVWGLYRWKALDAVGQPLC